MGLFSWSLGALSKLGSDWEAAGAKDDTARPIPANPNSDARRSSDDRPTVLSLRCPRQSRIAPAHKIGGSELAIRPGQECAADLSLNRSQGNKIPMLGRYAGRRGSRLGLSPFQFQGTTTMTDLPKVTGFEWRPTESMLVLTGEDGTKLALHFAMIPALGFQATKFIAGAEVQKAKASAQEWMMLSAPTVETARVQTMQTASGPRIVLMFDPDDVNAFPVSFRTPEVARQVGVALVEVAQALPASPTTRN